MENCPLKESKTCAVLNMPSCDVCPVSRGESPEKVVAAVETFLSETDGAEIASLFESEDCVLCLEQPGKKAGYVIYDLGHPVKKGEGKKSAAAFLTKKGPGFDMLLPLQFACCASCRKRLWWMRNLTGVTTGGLLLIAAATVSFEKPAEALRAVHGLLPLIAVAAAALIGYAGGRILKKSLIAKWDKKTLLHPGEHPAAKKLLEKGWMPAAEKKEQELFFTKKTVDRGLGTAPSSAYEREN